MTDITYLESVHHYEPYDDLKRLFELAGFPVRKVDTLDVGEPGVFITSPMNGDWREHLDTQAGKPRNAHLILWQLERPSSEGAVGKYAASNRNLMYRRYVDEVWVSDSGLADETDLRYVALGSHPDFGRPSPVKVWDVAHMSYMNGRRQSVLKHLGDVRLAPNCWPPKRDNVLAQTRVGLAIHQDDYPFIEPLRLALFAANALPVLMETSFDARPYGGAAEFASFRDLPAKVREMLAWDPARLSEMGERCRELMTVEHEFGKMVRAAVEQRVGNWR